MVEQILQDIRTSKEIISSLNQNAQSINQNIGKIGIKIDKLIQVLENYVNSKTKKIYDGYEKGETSDTWNDALNFDARPYTTTKVIVIKNGTAGYALQYKIFVNYGNVEVEEPYQTLASGNSKLIEFNRTATKIRIQVKSDSTGGTCIYWISWAAIK